MAASRRLRYQRPEHSAWVDVPEEWLCEHLTRRDGVLRLASLFPSQQLADLALALVLADGFSVPGVEGTDPAGWDLTLVPVPVLEWLIAAVLADFNRAFDVPAYLMHAIATLHEAGSDQEQDHGWRFEGDVVRVAPPTAIVQMWMDRRRYGILPKAGGWEQQPLALMVQMDVLELADNTFRHLYSKEPDLALLTPLQHGLVVWREKGLMAHDTRD